MSNAECSASTSQELDLAAVDFFEKEMANLLLIGFEKYQKPIMAELVMGGLIMSAKIIQDAKCRKIDFLKLAADIWQECLGCSKIMN